MGFQRIFGVAANDQIGELRRKETFQPAEALELADLLLNALFQVFIPLRKLDGLSLNLVMKLLDPEQRADSGEQFGPIDRLGEKIIGPGIEPLDSLFRRIESGYHNHGQ